MGCIRTLPDDYTETLKSLGIRAVAFNPFKAVLSLRLNNRDHRKIAVIDGHTAFTGGINLADEYINVHHRFGHWKDTAIMLKGDAAYSFTALFLQMWMQATNATENITIYQPKQKINYESQGFVQPYGDFPVFTKVVAENIYLNMIHRATKYIYITTPYLIIDHEMQTALALAAGSGIDVRIITPGIPDKKTVFMMTRAFYEPLTRAGVKIYEYTPGFMHAKMFVCDDEFATVGSVNLDYRSLYLHFECGAFMYRTDIIKDIKNDVLKVIQQSNQITHVKCLSLNRPHRWLQNLLRLFAPLM